MPEAKEQHVFGSLSRTAEEASAGHCDPGLIEAGWESLIAIVLI